MDEDKVKQVKEKLKSFSEAVEAIKKSAATVGFSKVVEAIEAREQDTRLRVAEAFVMKAEELEKAGENKKAVKLAREAREVLEPEPEVTPTGDLMERIDALLGRMGE